MQFTMRRMHECTGSAQVENPSHPKHLLVIAVKIAGGLVVVVGLGS